ncbi:MAG: ATP-dependent helicase [Desulfurococcales archaeon]|nr:ATP-dependent helicase [Desulfurococcales archaeon]
MKKLSRIPRDEEVYRLLIEPIALWFRDKYRSFTLPQRGAIPLIKKDRNVLVSSPTGTGKTLASFLGVIDKLYRIGLSEGLQDRVYTIYISPLRALNNDMKRNLLEPLDAISKTAKELGVNLPEIRVAVRTSDTSPYEKQKMTKNPPHILITTPESFSISILAPKFRENLRHARWVIIDEIHELAASKRGSHLMVSIERLEKFIGKPLQRIGMSATIAPLEEVAEFLIGYNDNGKPRDGWIIDARFAKPIDIRVLSPVKDLIRTPTDEVNESIYRTLARITRKYRTTLVFTNTRSATERVVYKLRRLLADMGITDIDKIEAHHSSLGRGLRLEVEEKLKRGELKVVVSSTSLELGIDIGYIDIVVLLSSPKSVSRLLQRIGRAGHHIRQISRGRLIVVDRDDLVECTVLAKAAMEKKIDKVKIPRNPLDVLAQQIVAMSIEDRWRIDDAYKLVRRSYPFKDLDFDKFMSVVRYLAGMYGEEVEKHRVYRKIWFDEDEGIFGRKRGSRMIFYLNSGTIPDESHVKVFTLDGRYVGNLEEAFVQILNPRDIFVLGGRTYEFIKTEGMRAYVRKVEGRRPTVPSWFSEMLPLAFDSALEVGKFRRFAADLISSKPRDEVIDWLRRKYRLSRSAAINIYKYIWEQFKYTGGLVPGNDLVLIEDWVDSGEENIIFHTLFGRRTNDALSRAYAYIIAEETSYPVRITVSDNGFMLTTPVTGIVDLYNLPYRVTPDSIEGILRKAVKSTEMMRRIFRHVAQRSFMILKRYKGREKSPHRMQLNAQTLLRVVGEMDGFPVLEETYREVFQDHMDLDSARKVLECIHNGEIEIKFFEAQYAPSPFAHHLVVQGYSDVVLMEDRRKLLMKLHELVIRSLERSTA